MEIDSQEPQVVMLHAAYSSEEGTFKVVFNSTEEYLYTPCLKLQPDYNPQKFDLFVLHNERSDYGEDSIYQVLVEDRTRIGWIFPIQALDSTDHSYCNNEHFLKYAYVAIAKLLNSEQVIKNNWDSYEITLSDLFSMNETILLLDNTNTDKIEGFSLDNYVTSLYAHGYSFTGNGNLYDSCEKVKDKHLILKPMSEQLKDSKYIVSMYKSIIPRTQDTIASFYLEYQMIEIMISKIFRQEFSSLINKIKAANPEDDLYEFKDELTEKANEAFRVQKLFGSYTKIDATLRNDLFDECNRLLGHYGMKTKDDAAKSLYAVRSLLVHRCYLIDEEGLLILKNINDVLNGVIIQMIISFKLQVVS